MIRVGPDVPKEWERVGRLEPLGGVAPVLRDDELHDRARLVHHDVARTDHHGGGEAVDIAVDDLVPHAGGSELELAGDRVLEGRDRLTAGRGDAAGVAAAGHPIALPVHDRHEQDDHQADDGADADGPHDRGVLLLAVAVGADRGPTRDPSQHEVREERDGTADDDGQEERVAAQLGPFGPAEALVPGEKGRSGHVDVHV